MKFSTIDEAIESIQNGDMIIVVDDEDRENEGDLIMAGEKVTPKAINFMATHGRGLICTPLSQKISKRLNFKPMVQENTESHHCNFTISVDYKYGTTSGISASDRAKTITAICTEDSVSDDFLKPGHVFPLIAKEGGVLVRAGHTEAAVDLTSLAGLKNVGVICEISREDGEMMRTKELLDFAKEHGLKTISIKSLIEYRYRFEKMIELTAETDLPTEFGNFKLKVFRNQLNGCEHVALIKGEVDSKSPVLVRVHSECLTGEVFCSLKCDCKAQLLKSLDEISKFKSGILLYMRQEGRGIGLSNKIKAYELQKKKGLNTVEANTQLGFAPDLRNYGIGAQILKELGCEAIDLLTNNPKKIVGLEGYGLKVNQRIPLEIAPTEENYAYLKAKKDFMGHLLDKLQ